jgi:GNAT superfamily N-acetyltransferase
VCASRKVNSVQIQVRAANPDDAPAVRQVLEASYPVLMAHAYDPAVLARALPVITRPNPKLLSSGAYYIAEIDGAPAGCGGWSAERPGSDTVIAGLGHIRHFATDARRIGRGVGRALYSACEASARRVGVRRFECQASLNAELFYQSLGFARVETIEVAMPPDIVFPSIRMVRDL